VKHGVEGLVLKDPASPVGRWAPGETRSASRFSAALGRTQC